MLFGEHQGEHIEDLAETDPGYMQWVIEQDWVGRELVQAIESALENPNYSGQITSRGWVVKKAFVERGKK
jgi:hypothetical protein